MDQEKLNGTQPSLPNGLPAKPQVERDGGHIREPPNEGATNGEMEEVGGGGRHVNGVSQAQGSSGTSATSVNRLDGLPIEVRQLTEHFRPFHRLINRSVQQTWNSFSELIDQLSEIDLSSGGASANTTYAKIQVREGASADQSPQTLEKKDRLLKFQQDRRALYIKLLVLHDWFRKSRGVDQVIELSAWIHEQRAHFAQSADFIGNMKRELALWQVPNPDLRTAIEVLSHGKVSTLSDLGYVPTRPLPPRAMLRTLRDIDILLCTRLTLRDQVPLPLSKYRIHDGRVTFTVPHEFELDLSVADEDASSQFFFIDFRLMSTHQSAFGIDRLHDDFAAKVNELLRTDGLIGCYGFLHDLTLSFKLNNLRRQAVDMARKQWSDSLKVDFINRTLVLQYWSNRPIPKSWIEIGINSGRRRKPRLDHRPSRPFLDLRWIPEKNENHDILIDFDAIPLSVEAVLHDVISRHSSIIMERFYNKLLECRLYGDGNSSLELCCSDTNPNDCFLRIQLTSSKYTTLAIEPISGSLILKPASSLSGKIEFELNRLSSPAEEGISRISVLRCLSAEQEVAQRANIAGWEIMQAFRLSQYELRNLFPPDTLRYVLFRQSSWQLDVMVAATFSADEDRWWLLYPASHESTAAGPALLSYNIDGFCAQQEDGTDPVALLSKLREYASAGIAFKVAERDLRQRRSPHQLPPLPRFGLDYQLPLMKVQYRPALARRALESWKLDQESQMTGSADREMPPKDIDEANITMIQSTIMVKFCGLSRTNRNALLLAKGRTTASARVLQSLDSSTMSVPKVVGSAGDFLITSQVSIGQSFVSGLFRSLQNFDKLLCYLTVIQSFDSMHIQSLSLSQIVVEYDREAKLSLAIEPQPSPSAVAVRLLPRDINPHARIAKFIDNQVADVRWPFTANLGGVLTMLATTRPLLSLFSELENLQTSPEVVNAATDPSRPAIRLHVIARSPTHYALQYFDSSATSRTMIARLEIFRHIRRNKTLWILRPAIEETVAYTRSSFIDNGLKRKLTEEIFKARDGQEWLSLDTGASCPIERPGELVGGVDRVIRAWANESLKGMLAGQLQDQGAEASKAEGKKKATESKVQGNVPSSPAKKQQQQRPRPPPQTPQQPLKQPLKTQPAQRQPPIAAPRPPPVDKSAQNRAAPTSNPQRRRLPPPPPNSQQQQQRQQHHQQQQGQQQQPQQQGHQTQPPPNSEDIITLD